MSESELFRSPAANDDSNDLAIVLTGGGARAAYQVGILRGIARHFPDLRYDIVTGVSAGAINATVLASRPASFGPAVEELARLWSGLNVENVFRVDFISLLRHFAQWALRLASASTVRPHVRGLVDTAPLRELLGRVMPTGAGGSILGIEGNVTRLRPRAVALTTLNYSNGQTITWVQGTEITTWQRPLRRSVRTELTLDHVMASAALPLFFPAVELPGGWYGDGGIRFAAPLSPALHLGARRILAVSTGYKKTFEEADEPSTFGYPPPAQIIGQLFDAIFLDVMDEDALRLERSNSFLETMNEEERRGFRVVDLLVFRPSVDLGRLAGRYEPRLPRLFRFLTRGLGTTETDSPDVLSLLMFQPDYVRKLIEIGESDAEARLPELKQLLGANASPTEVSVGSFAS